MQMNRRAFLQAGAAGLLGTLAASRLAFASAPTDNRFVFVFLRGGLDGLHALPPYADADYRRLRPGLALQADQVLSLDGYFGMHPSFAPLRPMWEAGSLAFVPAAATGYRERSHFDGQNMLENGSGHPFGARDGWLNRAILGLNAGDRRLGLALGPDRLPMAVLLGALTALVLAGLRAGRRRRPLTRLGRVPFGASLAMAGAAVALFPAFVQFGTMP